VQRDPDERRLPDAGLAPKDEGATAAGARSGEQLV
jgi:hypothetical protein